ncbi:AAA family ATPase [Pseudomonas sp. ADAK2]|uniref:AAA family ATPase n=1 Tax=unclassified Pseudomonas TaxID=196821 RepID=UPI001463CB89|nr:MULTISPECIES: AAA family ATPase [unclassified Pseudomonas]QJI41247.1 AAA family ATPase [Pseudomonas sp. ADAK7]QJI47551.1 AAA family ATPase [Pseudomonas sp. ADAK2]
MLIVFSGLPGTGKTTIAKGLAARLGALYLRIDSIEQAIRDADVLASDVGRSGYLVANALALTNLDMGSRVVVDCVNPVQESRDAWRETASRAQSSLIDIEVTCSDREEHRRRVETRQIDVPGLKAPDWQSVLDHDYEPWGCKPFGIDTALMSVDEAVAGIIERILLNPLRRHS